MEFTFTIDGRDLADERTTVHDVTSADAARTFGRGLLDGSHRSVSIGRGRGDEVEWLGAWDWCEGEPRWTPEE